MTASTSYEVVFSLSGGLYEVFPDTAWYLRIYDLSAKSLSVSFLGETQTVTWRGVNTAGDSDSDSSPLVPALSIVSVPSETPLPISLAFTQIQFEDFRSRDVIRFEESGLVESLTMSTVEVSRVGPIGGFLNGSSSGASVPTLSLTEVHFSDCSSQNGALVRVAGLKSVEVKSCSLSGIDLPNGAVGVILRLDGGVSSTVEISDLLINECVVSDPLIIEGQLPGPIVWIGQASGSVRVTVEGGIWENNVGQVLEIDSPSSVVIFDTVVISGNLIEYATPGLLSVSGSLKSGDTSVEVTVDRCHFDHNILHISSLLSVSGHALTVHLDQTNWTDTICTYLCWGTALSLFGDSGDLTVLSNNFSRNSAEVGQGGVFSIRVGGESSVDISDCTFLNNSLTNPGHGSVLSMSDFDQMDVNIRQSVFLENSAGFEDGGVLYFYHNQRGCDTSVQISDCLFSENFGGAIRIDSFRFAPPPPFGQKQIVSKLDLIISGQVLFERQTGGSGGAISIVPNEASPPGSVQRNVLIKNGNQITFEENTASLGHGGAIYHSCGTGDGSLVIQGPVQFVLNRAKKDGGAIYVEGCSVFHAGVASGMGGNPNENVIQIESNYASGLGGGMALLDVQSLQLTKDVQVKMCESYDGGGGLYVSTKQPVPEYTFDPELPIWDCRTHGSGGGVVVDYQGSDFSWFTPAVTRNYAAAAGGGVFFVSSCPDEMPNVHDNVASVGQDLATSPTSFRVSLRGGDNPCDSIAHLNEKKVFQDWYLCSVQLLEFADAYDNKLGAYTLPEYPVDFTVALNSTTKVTFGVPPDDVSILVHSSGSALSNLTFEVVVSYDGKKRSVDGIVSALGQSQKLSFTFLQQHTVFPVIALVSAIAVAVVFLVCWGILVFLLVGLIPVWKRLCCGKKKPRGEDIDSEEEIDETSPLLRKENQQVFALNSPPTTGLLARIADDDEEEEEEEEEGDYLELPQRTGTVTSAIFEEEEEVILVADSEEEEGSEGDQL